MLPSEPSLTRRRSENDAGLLRAWASRPHAWSWACGRLRARRPRSRGTTTPAAFAQPVPLRFEAQTRQPLSRDRLPVHRAESAPAAARAIPHRRRRRWPRESPAVDAIRQGHHRLVSDRRHERQRHRALAHGEVGREHAALGDDRGPVARTRAAVDLHGAIGGPVQHLRAVQLDHRRVRVRHRAAVRLLHRVHHQQVGCPELDRHVRELESGRLKLPDGPAELTARRVTCSPSPRVGRAGPHRHANAGITSLMNSSSDRFCSFSPRPRLA